MLSPDQLKIVSKEIEKRESVQEIFDYLAQTFDLKNCKPKGMIIRPQFNQGMIKAIQLLDPPLKR